MSESRRNQLRGEAEERRFQVEEHKQKGPKGWLRQREAQKRRAASIAWADCGLPLSELQKASTGEWLTLQS